MTLYEMLGIQPGVTAIIGSGGKSSLMHYLAQECPGNVAIGTTTHIYHDSSIVTILNTDYPAEKYFEHNKIVCFARKEDSGKLIQSGYSLDELADAADYVILEADGSHMLPIKAHASHEPALSGVKALPQNIKRKTILVVGAGGFCKPIYEVCHRIEQFCLLSGCNQRELVNEENLSRVINSEHFAEIVFINHMDLLPDEFDVSRFVRLLEFPVIAGSLKEGVFQCLY